jgi:hypothetical protein
MSYDEKYRQHAMEYWDDGQTFTGWESTGIELTADQKTTNPLTFTMPANDVTLVAKVDKLAESITFGVVPLTQQARSKAKLEPMMAQPKRRAGGMGFSRVYEANVIQS